MKGEIEEMLKILYKKHCTIFDIISIMVVWGIFSSIWWMLLS